MRKIILIAGRRDGFGERFKAILDGLAVSRYRDIDFGFMWPRRIGVYQAFNAIESINATFSSEFAKEFHFLEDDLRNFDSVRPLPSGTALSKEVLEEILAKDRGSVAIIYEKIDIDSFKDFLAKLNFAELFQSIKFSSNIENIRSKILQFFSIVDTGYSGIHIRGGDVIYGPYKNTIFFRNKGYPFALIIALTEELFRDGVKVIAFCQDDSVDMILNSSPGVVTSKAIIAEVFGSRAKDFSVLELALADIFIMLNCNSLYGSVTSGFVGLAAKVKSIEVVDPVKRISASKRIVIYEESLRRGGYPDVFQESFCLVHMLLDSRIANKRDKQLWAAERLIELQPQSDLYRALLIFTYLESDLETLAENFLKTLTEKEAEVLTIASCMTKKVAGKYHLKQFLENFLAKNFEDKFSLLKALRSEVCRLIN
ncbi:hypothetical protein Thiowin_00113 [Thiorhodovibrio winogradskyi]|uniref:Uncharacterized protein n=1 Tax=Thiorhodovibrio winogradskyi TaxID=77007 RepID=A0ABZ0S1H5_9GAMM|nr:hypothetical protein [Thiorhodovibrio winogradskyi]